MAYKKLIPKVKTKLTENIKDFSNNKQLYLLSKPHSSLSVLFIEDKYDEWFVHVKYYKTKSGEVTDSSMIIKKDVEDWLSHIKNSGYIVKNNK